MKLDISESQIMEMCLMWRTKGSMRPIWHSRIKGFRHIRTILIAIHFQAFRCCIAWAVHKRVVPLFLQMGFGLQRSWETLTRKLSICCQASHILLNIEILMLLFFCRPLFLWSSCWMEKSSALHSIIALQQHFRLNCHSCILTTRPGLFLISFQTLADSRSGLNCFLVCVKCTFSFASFSHGFSFICLYFFHLFKAVNVRACHQTACGDTCFWFHAGLFKVQIDITWQICCRKPGEVAIWSNGRVMHGREGYERGAPRHLQGAYLDYDEIQSTVSSALADGVDLERLFSD